MVASEGSNPVNAATLVYTASYTARCTAGCTTYTAMAPNLVHLGVAMVHEDTLYSHLYSVLYSAKLYNTLYRALYRL